MPNDVQRIVAAFALALVVGANVSRAQKPNDEPRRPRLPAGVDTNNARAYYDYGLAKLDRDPEDAADAFYWAIRINPTLADPYYARRSVLLLSDKIRFQKDTEE